MLRIEAVKSDKEFARDFTVLRDNYLESLRTARKQRVAGGTRSAR